MIDNNNKSQEEKRILLINFVKQSKIQKFNRDYIDELIVDEDKEIRDKKNSETDRDQ